MHDYLFPEVYTTGIDYEHYTAKSILSFYLLFNGLIPLDLIIQFSMVKMFYIFMLESDVEMTTFDPKTLDKKTCKAQNFNMLEEMSHINHIFCDKTGTLTQNKLLFKAFAIGSSKFELKDHSN